MRNRFRTLKLSRLMYAIFAFAGILLAMLVARPVQVQAAEIPVSWSGVSLSSGGDATWSLNYSGDLRVDKYELKLARKASGNWNTSYKTVKTEDDSYSFSFSSKGQYYFVIRALFVGGDQSSWSGQSNTVSVTSDDIDSPDRGGGSAYIIVPNGSGGNVLVPAGPGMNYQYTTTTIGPNGSVTTTTNGVNTATGPGAYGYYNNAYNNSGAATITGNTGQSGWIRDGNRWRYRYANNTWASNSWDHIDNEWYYFDQNGYMSTGWVYYNSNWYLCGLDGKMKTGWNMVNNKWYYMDKSGIMQTGYVTVDGIHYYCDKSGARLESAYNPDGHYYDESGVQIK